MTSPDTIPAPAFDDPMGSILMDARIVDAANSMDGKHWPDPSYAEWLFPASLYPVASREADAKTSWSCLLHLLACLRAANCTAPELGNQLAGHGGEYISWLMAIGKRRDAIVDLDANLSLIPGDLVIIGGKPEWGGDWHGLPVTDVTGSTIRSCDGGQVMLFEGQSVHCIRTRTRVLSPQGSDWWLRDADGSKSPQQTGVGRRIWAVIRGAYL